MNESTQSFAVAGCGIALLFTMGTGTMHVRDEMLPRAVAAKSYVSTMTQGSASGSLGDGGLAPQSAVSDFLDIELTFVPALTAFFNQLAEAQISLDKTVPRLSSDDLWDLYA